MLTIHGASVTEMTTQDFVCQIALMHKKLRNLSSTVSDETNFDCIKANFYYFCDTAVLHIIYRTKILPGDEPRGFETSKYFRSIYCVRQ